MATGGFRQQCKSCDSMVLIKDRTQVGKKIDCPKCKYRFVVEAPEEEPIEAEVVEDEAPAPPAKKPAAKPAAAPAGKKPAAAAPPGPPAQAGTPAKKKPAPPPKKVDDDDEDDEDDEDDAPRKRKPKGKGKKEGSTLVVIVGVGLAVIAVAILGIGGYFIFFSEREGVGPPTRVAFTAQKETEKASPSTDKTEEKPGLIEITNLLPNDTQAVAHINLKGVVNSLIGRAGFDSPGAFQRKMLEAKLALKFDDITRLVVAQNMQKKWVFCVIRTARPITLDELKGNRWLSLKPVEDNPFKPLEYFVTEPTPWLDRVGKIVAEIFPQPNAPPVQVKPRSMGVFLKDPQTLVLADIEPLKEFLEVKGEPKKHKPPAAKPDAKPAGKAAGGPSDRFLSISPGLKTVLDRIEGKPAPLISAAWDTEALKEAIKRAVEAGGKADEMKEVLNHLQDLFAGSSSLGVSVQTKDGITLTLGMELKDEDLPKKVQDQWRLFAHSVAVLGIPVQIDGQVTTVIKTLPLGSSGWQSALKKLAIQTFVLEKVLLVNLELQLTAAGNDFIIREILRPGMLTTRAIMEMAAAPPRPFDLANAAVAWSKKESKFPRGTLEPAAGKQHPIPPKDRVSWMVELLPFLGFEDLASKIDRQGSWRPYWDPTARTWLDDNARLGGVVIPAFLDPSTPPGTWWVNVPKVPNYTYGATQFVGIGGVGLDAASYDPTDPAMTGKLGIFGYDRETKLDDIKDGLGNTILMIQVPPTYKRPWIAGGGATVMGVPDKDSIKPFVSQQLDGKGGTYALMADGSVRFISDKIGDDVFKALCTMKGGEKVDVEKETILVPAPKAELKVQPVAEK